MNNIIAVIWDFDKTLVNGYMEDPIFKEYDVDAKTFCNEVNALPKKYMSEQNIRVRGCIHKEKKLNCGYEKKDTLN